MSTATSPGRCLNVRRALLLGALALITPRYASAQADALSFVGGAAVALGAHEMGHVIFDVAFGASPGLQKVSFGGIPFFAITHPPVSPAREFTISSAGFWVQHATDEILLRNADLRAQHAPFLKGMLAFNVLASVAYAGAAFARVGPLERDTRGMAISADVDEPVIGALILAPAVFDAWRYYAPDARWAKWSSRAVKVAGALLVIRAAAR
jgi:hypothetical protein